MKKAIAILLTALLLLTVFVSCEGDVEDMFGKTVSFNGNGSTSGQMAQMKVKKGEEVTLPANEFTRTDYVFAGWNTQADGSGTGYADKAKASFDDNTVLYAQWVEEVTITFNANDGSETPATKTQKVGKEIETALDANTFTFEGYYFAGWSSSVSGDIEYADMAKITLSADKTLYAVWSDNPIVSLSEGTGISEVTGAGSYAPGATVSIDATMSDGYKWSKWTQTTGGADVSTTKEYSFTMETENINYTANATPISYTVAFDKNGATGTEEMDSQSFEYDEEKALTANAFTWEGHSFTGWNTTSSGSGDSYADGASVSNLTTTDGATVTLYAQWSEGAVVTFHKNDGVTPESTTTQLIPFNTETALTENSFSRDTYIFLGWNTAKDGTGTAYSDEQKVTLTANLDLYAQWAIDLATTTLSKTSWTNGNVYSMSADVLISDRITVTGSVTLILPADTTLTASKGITVTRTVTGTNSLTINGKGSLSAGGSSSPEHAAGIGGIYQTGEKDGGTVTINGGIVTATGGKSAAGIGGCTGGAGGTVTINGGTVTATGGSGTFPDGPGTGIGAGYNGSSHGTLKIGAGCALTGGSASADTLLLGPVNEETTYTGASHPRYMNVSTVSEIKDSTSAITLKSGVYTTDKTDTEVVVNERITVEGSVFLLLPDGAKLTASKGITVSSGNTLVIDKYGSTATGTGTLTATGLGGAGIGGGVLNAGGTVTINGGTVTATGDSQAAGIGGGDSGAGGTVTINGGTVTATGGASAAGIGGGSMGAGGTVTINGGSVFATGGGSDAAGIGAGDGISNHGTLTIADGVIMMVSTNNTDWSVYSGTRTRYMKTPTILTSSTNAWQNDIYTMADDLTISDRITVTGNVMLFLTKDKTLTASSGITVTGTNSLTIIGGTGEDAGILVATGVNDQAGIGGGGTNQAGGTITITGGNITANNNNGNGAGIGGGLNGAGGKISISGGTVTANGGNYAAGIGGGCYGAGGTVTISGGSVTANGGNLAVGIGKGYDGGSDGTLKIGSNVHVYKTGEAIAYADGPQDNVTTRYQNMTVNYFI